MGGNRIRLLVVDDDRAIRELLARVAERAGFEVDTAADGLQAMEMLKAKEYAIAVVDLMMPRVSGYELVARMGTLSPWPIVIVATAMTNAEVATLDDSMVRQVIRKPFDIRGVADTLIEAARLLSEKQPAASPEQGPEEASDPGAAPPGDPARARSNPGSP